MEGLLKFIHAADIHLDSPLVGLQLYEGAPVEEIRGATRKALQNLVELAAAEKVDFILIAGDLYDGDWKDFNTGLFLYSQMARLRDEGIRVFIISGNHDAASQITKHLRLHENVKYLSVRNPETVIIEELDLAIHGQGYPVRAVTEDMTGAYPLASPYHFNIGLLHTSLDGRQGHEPYAPTNATSLLTKGYDYWALGHVHAREIVHEAPWIVFPGNMQGRHIRETGPKGCMLVEVEYGQVIRVEPRELDVMRWAVATADAGKAADGDDVLQAASKILTRTFKENKEMPLAVRLEIIGATKAHRVLLSNPERWKSELRAIATDISGGTMWLEKIRFSTKDAIDTAVLIAKNPALVELMNSIDGLAGDADLVKAAVEALGDLGEKLPHELKTGDEAIRLDDPETVKRAAEGVRQVLMDRILAGGEEL
jgi:DNA repair exonuclease SbcCD nuclease subunit